MLQAHAELEVVCILDVVPKGYLEADRGPVHANMLASLWPGRFLLHTQCLKHGTCFRPLPLCERGAAGMFFFCLHVAEKLLAECVCVCVVLHRWLLLR